MQSKKLKRIGAILLAAAMTLQCAGSFTANAADANTQMSSEKEVVYVDTYNGTERKQNFDANWKFYLGDASGAEQQNFDDSSWKNISLPHDYSIEQEYSSSMEAESAYLQGGTGWYRKHFVAGSDLAGKEIRIDFGGVYMNSTVWVNGTKLGTHPYGYTPFSFDITDYVKVGEENVITVKVEHQTPSSRWYSGSGIYRSVNLTVTNPVHVDLCGTQIESPNLETQKGGEVDVTIKTTVTNAGDAAVDVTLVHTMYEKGTENSIGTVTTDAAPVAAGANADITATLKAANPDLWDVDSPNLYTVKTEVKVGGEVIDTYEADYGFRYFSFDNNTGFTLNGEAMKLKGVCMHHDQGSLGAEAYYAAVYRQMKIMKEMGCNAIRVTHNPASDELLQACEELGLLVIEEAFDGWLDVKNGNSYDYSNWFDVEIESDNQIIGAESGMTWAEFDIKAMVNRGKNSPAIIMWSLGNEVQEGTGWQSTSQYPTVVNNLIGWVKEIDTTRPVTNGDNVLQGLSTQAMLQVDANIYAAGGVVGINYGNTSEYDNIHNTYPNWILYGAETASHVNSRGEYSTIASNSLNSNKALTSYDYSAVSWGATASSAWYDVITRDYLAGEFVWTGFDYLGEPTPANGTGSGAATSWPSPKNSYFGIVDTAGLPKDNYYFYQSQWNDEVNTLHVLPAWNSDVVYKGNSKGVPVVVYSDAASVELFFTGTDGVRESLGKKTFTEKTTAAGFTYQIYEGSDKESTTDRNLYLTWYVPYRDGMIEAVAYDKDGVEITNTEGRSYVKTTGEEAKLEATVDRQNISADGKDLAYITIDVTDAEGNIVPDAKNNVKFNVTGDGVLVGVDNGKQADHQSYQDDNRNAYNGSLVAIVQSTKAAGSFTVTATADGLESDSVTVTTTAAEGEETGVQLEGFYMSKNYYVKVGNMPVLPEEIETRYTDGTSEVLAVVWNEISSESISKVGSFNVSGIVGGLYTVSVTINMIDELGALLNYSTTTSKGIAPVLPQTRPAVAQNGEILDVAFPVEWNEISADKYAEAGTFVVNGKADVLGTEMTVTATVRVQNETITIGDSISAQALTLKEDIPEDMTSDTLAAIIDGSTIIGANTEGGRNTTAWSNYNAAQADDTTAEVTFGYATQQRIGEIVVHFWKDGYSAEFPDAGTTVIKLSEDGTNWTTLEAAETIGAEAERVKAYTYSFPPTTATFIKICVTNSTAQKTAKACTGITEVEIKKAEGTFATYATAELGSVIVNDKELTAAEIKAGVYYEAQTEAAVEATGKDNAAVTVLPAYNDKIKLIIESEDHKVRNEFVIRLGEAKPFDPTDSSMDVPTTGMTAISGSQYLPGTSNEGPDDYVLDGNTDTHWHTNWNTSEATDVNKRWVGVELAEATSISGIRYLPRQYGGQNGAVTQYRVEYKAAADGEWITAATGTWAQSDGDWKYVEFEDDVTAAAVRVVGVGTWADSGNNAHMSCAEFRLVKGAGSVTPPPATVDKAALAAKIAEAKELKEEDYTAASWANLETALAAANTVNGNAAATQEEVNSALAALKTAIEALEEAETPGSSVPAGDYPVDKMKLSAGSTQSSGSESLVIDNDTSSFWETRWATQTTDNNAGKLWFMVELEDAALIDQLKYYPRYQGTDLEKGDQNGFISKYRVEVSMDGETWTEVASGNWSPVDGWLTADFDAVTAKYVRLTGVETLNNGNATTTDMSIAELRVRVAEGGQPPVVEPCKHTETEVVYVKEATCTEEGYTGDKVCTVCKTTVETGKAIAKLEHAWSDWTVVKEATTEEAGLKERTCSVCDKKDTEVISKLDPENPDQPENPDDKPEQKPEQKPDDKPDKDDNKPGSPVTGDTAPVFVWFMAAFVMAAVAFAVKKKTR